MPELSASSQPFSTAGMNSDGIEPPLIALTKSKPSPGAGSMLMTTTVMAEDFYAALQRPYLTDLLADQHLGASIGWASGDVPMLIVMIAMFFQWVGADEREARRSDRRQERAAESGQGTDELADYNAYLASLQRRDRSQD